MACASLFGQVGWLVVHCIVQCDALTNQRLNSDETVGRGNNDFSIMSQVQEMSCRWVALPHARKTKLTRETCIIQNTHHVSKQH